MPKTATKTGTNNPAPTYKLTWKCAQNPHNLPTYLGNPRIKRGGVVQPWTPFVISEWDRCRSDPDYFCRTYIKVIKPGHGLIDYEPYPYQIKMMESFEKNRFNIVLACRQSGKSVGFIGYVAWLCLFSDNAEHIVIAANKLSTAKEMLTRIQRAIENLPFFLQHGCIEYNKTSITFDTDTKIEAIAASSDGARGKSASLMICDEFAFVKGDSEFYESNYPLISSDPAARMIIVSTPNGINNEFYRIWDGAVKKRNTFNPIRVDWWDVPGRDEAWKEETMGNIGEKKFSQEFGNSFNQTSSTLIDMEFLIMLKAEEPLGKDSNVNVYDLPKEDHSYILVADVSKGRGIDFSTISVIDITKLPYKQVATYRDNNVSPMIFPNLIYRVARKYNDAFTIIEANAGEVVYKILYYDLEYTNCYSSRVAGGRSMGLEINRKVKRIGTSNLKDLIEQQKLLVVDEETIKELYVYEAKGESFEARDGSHDDMIAGLVMFGWFADTDMFGDMALQKLRDMMSEERQDLIKRSVPILGLMPEDTAMDMVEFWGDETPNKEFVWSLDPDWDLKQRDEDEAYNILF